MTQRYFVPDLPAAGGLVSLPDQEAQHATRVMRIQIGDPVTLFDGRGHESAAVVASAGRKECLCEAAAAKNVDRQPACRLQLGIALPKPDRARELIERLTELGVESVTPLVAGRTQRPPTESLLEKLRRGVIEACKQSGRNQLMDIHAPMPAEAFFTRSDAELRLLVHPHPSRFSWERLRSPEHIVAAIGPEGGWTDAEVDRARQAGLEPVDLGERIYRVETAAVTVAALAVTR